MVAGVALATATTLTVTSAAIPQQQHDDVRLARAEVSLTAGSSVLNIPINLLIDLINIPNSEAQAFDLLAKGMLFGGPWWVTDASNVWGTDPADYMRFVAAASMAIPIPALSGLTMGSDGYYDVYGQNNNGLAVQFAKFLAAQLPVDPDCGADYCVPNTPVSPITGISGIDQSIWNLLMFTGAVDFPLLRNFFKVPMSQLFGSGYDFGPIENTSGHVWSMLGIKGTTTEYVLDANGNKVQKVDADGNLVVDADGNPVYETKELMPWANTNFQVNITGALTDYLQHLMSDPSQNKIQLPSLTDIGRSLQTLIAGLVVSFDPITPGSPFCAGFCAYMDNSGFQPIVQAINNFWPGNTTIEEWLAGYAAGEANVPTAQNVAQNIELFRRAFFNFWDFNNAPLPDDWSNIPGFNPSDWSPSFLKLWQSLGLKPPTDGVDNTTVEDAGLTNGVYGLKGMEVPALLILETPQQTIARAQEYAGAYTDADVSDGNVANVKWFDPSDLVGPWALSTTIGQDPNPTIVGYSRGAQIASEWKKDFNANAVRDADGNIVSGPKNKAGTPVTPTFVLIGNPERPNGGFSTRINPFWTDQVATPTWTAGIPEGQKTTTDIAYQYDPFSDLPTNLLNPFALANSVLGLINHLSYPTNPAATALHQATKGDTDYYLLPSSTVPLLYPIAGLPVVGKTLADILDPVTRVLIEAGYNRNISPGQTAAMNPFYFPNPVQLAQNIVKAVVVGMDNAFEDLNLGRPFKTERPDTMSGGANGAYGIGGPTVEVPTPTNAAPDAGTDQGITALTVANSLNKQSSSSSTDEKDGKKVDDESQGTKEAEKGATDAGTTPTTSTPETPETPTTTPETPEAGDPTPGTPDSADNSSNTKPDKVVRTPKTSPSKGDPAGRHRAPANANDDGGQGAGSTGGNDSAKGGSAKSDDSAKSGGGSGEGSGSSNKSTGKHHKDNDQSKDKGQKNAA